MAQIEAAYEALMAEHGLHEWARYAGREPPDRDPAAAMQALRRREQELVVRAAQLARDPAAGVTAREAELWERARRGMLLLANVVHDAAATTLDQKLTRATGAPLAPDAYLAYLSGR